MTEHELVGRKVRLTGSLWSSEGLLPRRGAIQSVASVQADDHLMRRPVVTIDSGGLVFLDKPDGMFGGVLLPKRTTIWVYAFQTADQSGGFFWAATLVDRTELWREYNRSTERDEQESEVIVQLDMHIGDGSAEARAAVTDYIEGELQDAIAAGLVGTILERYQRPTVGQEG